MVAQYMRLAQCSLPALALSFRFTHQLLWTTTKRKNSGQKLGENSGPEQKADGPATMEKLLVEKKVKFRGAAEGGHWKKWMCFAYTEKLWQKSQKLMEQAKLYGIQALCKDLLEVADILEKAI